MSVCNSEVVGMLSLLSVSHSALGRGYHTCGDRRYCQYHTQRWAAATTLVWT